MADMKHSRYKVVMKPADIERLRDETSVDALQLNEDLFTLRTCRKLLGNIDARNISDPGNGELLKDSMITMLRSWERYAQLKLRTRYLSPQ